MNEDDYIFSKGTLGSGNVTINGRQIAYSGGSISVINGKVIIDGRAVDAGNAPVISIVVEGNAGEVSGEFTEITVLGDADNVKNMSGSVEIRGDVAGNVKTMSGDVTVGRSIAGNVKTMSGDITSHAEKPSRF